MPHKKVVLSLTEMSVNCLANLMASRLDPRFLMTEVERTCDRPTDKENIPDNQAHQKEINNYKDYTVDHKPSDELNVGLPAQEFLVCLVQGLASLKGYNLHEIICSSILTLLNRLYVKHQNPEMRALIRKIAPLIINAFLRTLDFGSFRMFTEASMFEVIYTRLKEASGLKKLMFGRSCYWRSKSMTNLSKVLEGLQSLSVLHIHCICKPHMLQGLSDSCPQLKELSLMGSKDITDEEVPLMLGFVHLETLDISGTYISPMGQGSRSLLLNLPKLSCFTHCPFNSSSDTLIFASHRDLFRFMLADFKGRFFFRDSEAAFLLRCEELSIRVVVASQGEPIQSGTTPKDAMQRPGSDSKPLAEMIQNLKTFWLFDPTTEELLFAQNCLYLQNLKLDFQKQDLPNMDALGALPHLSSLSLEAVHCNLIQLVRSIIDFASRLTTLQLFLIDEWFFVAPCFNVIVQHCRNLTSLSMKGDYKGRHSLEESDARLDFTLPPEGLRQLVTVTLCGCVTHLRLLHLLSHAPNLETLHLDGKLKWINDETIADAIRQNLLSHIKDLWFNVPAGVTFNSVRRLLQSENELRRIGRLCLMSSATKDGYLDLLYLAKRLNISTDLVWGTDQRQLQIEANNFPMCMRLGSDTLFVDPSKFSAIT